MAVRYADRGARPKGAGQACDHNNRALCNNGTRSTVRAVGSVAASNAARAAAKDFHTPDPSCRRGLLAAANADLPEGAAPQPVCWRCFRRGHTWEACKGTAKYPKSGDCPYTWTVTTQTTKKVGN